jgi:hypothetical protein
LGFLSLFLGVLPSLYAFDGAKVELTSLISPNFQVAHSFQWASQQMPNLYSFSTVYAGNRVRFETVELIRFRFFSKDRLTTK